MTRRRRAKAAFRADTKPPFDASITRILRNRLRGTKMTTDDKLYTGAQMVMESFLREGVDTIFGLPGGANLPLYDVLENGGVGIRPVPEGVVLTGIATKPSLS